MGHDITAEVDGQEIACLRRAAHSNLNQVIYLALDFEEAYGGTSGLHYRGEFTKKQFETAKEYLEATDFPDVSRPFPNPCDTLLRVGNPDYVPVVNADVEQEQTFVRDCLAYLDRTGAESIIVYFD